MEPGLVPCERAAGRRAAIQRHGSSRCDAGACVQASRAAGKGVGQDGRSCSCRRLLLGQLLSGSPGLGGGARVATRCGTLPGCAQVGDSGQCAAPKASPGTRLRLGRIMRGTNRRGHLELPLCSSHEASKQLASIMHGPSGASWDGCSARQRRRRAVPATMRWSLSMHMKDMSTSNASRMAQIPRVSTEQSGMLRQETPNPRCIRRVFGAV